VVPLCTVSANASWFLRDTSSVDPNSSIRVPRVSVYGNAPFAFIAGITGELCQCNHPDWDEDVDGPWVTWNLASVSGVVVTSDVSIFVDKDTVLFYSADIIYSETSPIVYELIAHIGGVALDPIYLDVLGW